jgi:HlyD family secretion protein
VAKRWIKRILTVAFGLGLTAAVVNAFLPKPVAVDLGRVETGNLQVYVEEDGKTRVRDRYVVSSPLAGRLRRIKLRAGDQVPPGRMLASIEPADPGLLDPRALAQAEARVRSARSALDKAGAQLKSAEVALNLAETEYDWAEQLLRKNAMSKSELETKRLQKRAREEEVRRDRSGEEFARSELELAQAALLQSRPHFGESDVRTNSERANFDHDQFEIPAPALSTTGRPFHVLRVLQESEAVVTAGTPLLELGDLTDLEVEIEVLSSDAVKIAPGAKVLLEQWGGDNPLQARVRIVEPSGHTKVSALGVEEQRVYVIADFPEREKIPTTLGDGFRVEAKIIIWEKEGVLKVPTSALFRHGDGWAVFRVEHQRALLHSVKLGRKSALAAEVIEGLSLDDTVIVHPSDKIADGIEIVPR